MNEPIGKAYKPWLLASLGLLVASLAVLGVAIVAGFVHFAATATPLWVVVLGAAAMLGVGLGFGGFFCLMMIAGWRSFRESRRVQIIPPQPSRR